MYLLKGLVLVLLLVSNPVLAQIKELIVDESTMSVDDIKDVFINSTGGLEIHSVLGDFEVEKVDAPNEGPAAGSLISNFTLDGQTNLMMGVGVLKDINWSTDNADGCVASTEGIDVLDDWITGTEVGPEGTIPVKFQTAGNYILLLDCYTEDNSDTDAVIVTVTGASITMFEVTPDTVVKGEAVTLTLTWSSEYTKSCSGSWAGEEELLSSDTTNLTTTLESTTTFTLTCTGVGGDSVNESFEVVVPTPTTQLACEGNVTLSGNEVSWNSFFMNNWPGPKTQKKRVGLPVKGYLAIKFNTGNVKDVGALSSIEAAGTHGYRLGSVSRCAGDFKVEEVCQWKWGTWGGIIWDTSGETDTGNCNLEPGEDYYWNMTFTDGEHPNSSRCIGTYCETWVIPVNNDYVAP